MKISCDRLADRLPRREQSGHKRCENREPDGAPLAARCGTRSPVLFQETSNQLLPCLAKRPAVRNNRESSSGGRMPPASAGLVAVTPAATDSVRERPYGFYVRMAYACAAVAFLGFAPTYWMP